MLMQMACSYLGNSDDAEDAVQEALLKLWSIHEEVHMPMAALARVVTRNNCLIALRRQQTRGEAVDFSQIKAQEAALWDTEDPTTEHQSLEQLLEIIDRLPEMQKLVLRMRHFEGMEMADIARLTGSTEVTIRKMLSRARLSVRASYLETFGGKY